ncbi:MAG: hypothetical protein ACTSXS_01335 [Candidatus Thorarchaeota archaeon]
MGKAKWIMKQYWRLSTIRAIIGVLLGMLVLGRYYYQFVPILRDMSPSVLGAITLGMIFLGIFLFVGYLYDDVSHLWNERMQVAIEKDPFSYVPFIRTKMAEYPYFYIWIYLLKELSDETQVPTQHLKDLVLYLEKYFQRRVDIKKDLFTALDKGIEFLKQHPFVDDESFKTTRRSIRTRIKKQFLLYVWRLTWVQNFTGLLQDSLVFAALYTGILFGVDTSGGSLPWNILLLGVLFISIPIMSIQIIIGWYYDKKLQLWTPDQIVKVERNPYSYIPDPKLVGFGQPIIQALVYMLREVSITVGVSTSKIEKLGEYMDEYFALRSKGEKGMREALDLHRNFSKLFEMSPTTS